MRSTEDFTGQRFGALTVIAEVPPENYRNGKRWLCRCECGAELVLTPSQLAPKSGIGGRKSCGKCGFGGHVGTAKYLGNSLHKESPAERKAREAAKKLRAANMEAIREMVRASGGMTYGQYVARRAHNGTD